MREKDGRRIYPIMHPAAALHRQELRSVIQQDFRAIPEVLARLNQAPAEPAPAAAIDETPPPEQLSLF